MPIRATPDSETYSIGGWNEKSNIDSAQILCTLLDKLKPWVDG